MKILVAVADYPNLEGGKQLAYVRTRNVWYVKHGIEVDVLNFAARANYVIDGISVFTLQSVQRRLQSEHYDLLVCHAANVRNHYRFLRRYGNAFPKIVFFYHGHESVKLSKTYPKPYGYQGNNIFRTILQDLYDDFKLCTWRGYIKKNYKKSYFIFVSETFKKDFLRWVNPPRLCLEGRSAVVYNSVGADFQEKSYNQVSPKKYDFITIRSILDMSAHAVDIVNDLALLHPDKTFLVIGHGAFFSHYPKAANLTWIDKAMTHGELLSYIDESRCALMPTKRDTQGVMSCELATYGIPLITSDLPVCHEVFEGFNNVAFIDNDHIDQADIVALSEQLSRLPVVKNPKYFMANTCDKEIEILRQVAGC